MKEKPRRWRQRVRDTQSGDDALHERPYSGTDTWRARLREMKTGRGGVIAWSWEGSWGEACIGA
jgi:hypothetical protein